MTIPRKKAWYASMALGITRRQDHRSVLSRREHSGPMLIQKPLYPDGPQTCHVVLLHPPSGIAGGDALDIAVDVAAGAHATVTTPGATRWYKANGNRASQSMRLSVAAGACLDWLPLENIFFEQADAQLDTEIELAPDALAIGWEISQLGSITKSTHWDTGCARTRTTLRVGGRLLWVEQGAIGAQDPIRQRITGLAGHPVHANLWCFGPQHDEAKLDALTDDLPWSDLLRAGLTVMRYDDAKALYLVRAVGLHAEDARHLLIRIWLHMRRHVLDLPATPLRLWRT